MIYSQNLHRLATKEDNYHIHKTLGVIILINYIYRYFLLFNYGSMFLTSSFELLLIGFHALLSLSSLIFHIPNIRNRKSPMIYPEFRLHSIVFALRSVLCSIIEYFSNTFGSEYSLYLKMIVCILTMVVADIITNYYKDTNENKNTMRNMPYSEEIPKEKQKEITHMHSSMQIGATLYMLFNIDSAFSPMFGIQLAALLMTLVRKNIVSSNSWHLFYALSLWINVFCYWSLSPFDVILQILSYNIFRYLRFSLNLNKYIGWIITFGFFISIKNVEHEFINDYLKDTIFANTLIVIYLVRQIRKCYSLFTVKKSVF